MVATTSSALPPVDIGPPVPDASARRTRTIIRTSPLLARAVAGVPYTIRGLVPGDSGTIPNLRMVYARVTLARAVELPAGMPYLDEPGEDDPGYGQPIPLDEAVRYTATSNPGTTALLVGVDLDNGRILTIQPWDGRPLW